jgi:protein SCO1/2
MSASGPGSTWATDDIIAYVDVLRRHPTQRDALVALLDDRAPIYAGRASNEVERLRGYLLASFAITGLPESALRYVFEELESGRNPQAVAAAARAVRGGTAFPDEVVTLLLSAIQRLRAADDFVSFDTFSLEPSIASSTTVLSELFRTLAWLGPFAHAAQGPLQAMLDESWDGFSPAVSKEIRNAVTAVASAVPNSPAHCCAPPAGCKQANTHAAPASIEDTLREVELQDQSGALLSLGEALLGKPSAVAFFYTRCMNPEKCSLTITKLARLQRRVYERGLRGKINIAGITYDPAFDLPPRLRVYGADRGMEFDSSNRLLRTTGPFEHLRQYFDLGVSYGPVTVNRHRLDFVVLDETGRVSAAFRRRLWQVDDVLEALQALTRESVCHAAPG